MRVFLIEDYLNGVLDLKVAGDNAAYESCDLSPEAQARTSEMKVITFCAQLPVNDTVRPCAAGLESIRWAISSATGIRWSSSFSLFLARKQPEG